MREAVSSRQGLTEQEAQSRLQTHGPNELAGDPRPPVWRIFLSQYLDIMTGILLACTAISLLMGEVVEAVSIAVIVLLNGLLGFFQEYRTEKTLSALKAMAAPTARVYRDGKPVRLPAAMLVPGDVVTLTAGDRIPADGRLFDAAAFRTDESLLTGEAAGVAKATDDPVFMGCTVTEGRGTMEVTGTGMDTEMGRIAGMLRTIRPAPTPLQVKLAGLSRWIAAGCLLICGVVTLTGLLRGGKLLDMLLTGVSLAVAAVPEGLPAIVTVSLALAVRRMVERRALVRRLHAVEALGCATVICSDKTGTITQNRMTVTALSLPDGEWNTLPPDRRGQRMCQVMTYCNNASLSPDGDWGSATELALLRLAKGHSLLPMKRLSEQPFDSARKRMSVVAEDQNGGRFTLCKGGCESVLSHCSFWEDGEGVHPLTPTDKARFLKETQTLAGKALRVIALAYRPGEGGEEELIFLGLLGLMDPPREGVKEAVRSCRRAGIRTIMITGDHPATACAIGAQVGIFREGDGVFTGDELDKMDEKALAKAAKTGTVFARVSPRHKLLLVRALKAQGELVAMTGDGVNDAPAVKEADIGVAMGKSGSDVTREAADLLLLDDNFATLVGAVDEGRSIYGNIRKFIRYLLSCNIGEVITMFFGMLFGMPVVLLPIQILLINLVTDGLPAIALGLEPRDPNAMCRPPRKPGEGIFAHGLGGKICFRGFLIGLSTLASFTGVFRLTGSVDTARTGALITLVMAQLIHVFECKSEEVGLFSVPFFNNKKLLLAVLFSLAVLFAVVYLPLLQGIFSTVPLSAAGLALSLGLAALVPVVTAWKR